MHVGATCRRLRVAACTVINANKSQLGLALLFAILASGQSTAQDCRTIAAAPPLFTFGGPATVPKGEAAFATDCNTLPALRSQSQRLVEAFSGCSTRVRLNARAKGIARRQPIR
jgi:hypothetical protein